MFIFRLPKKQILIKIISSIVAQILLLTNFGYPENISSSYIANKGLRVPVGFGDAQRNNIRTEYRIIASMALGKIADSLKLGIAINEIIEKSFDDKFKAQLDGPIYIRQNLITHAIYLRYGNAYMSLVANGIIYDTSPEEFIDNTQEIGVIKSSTLFTLDDYIFDKGQSKRSAMGRNVGIIGLVTALVLYGTDAKKQVMLFGSGIIEPFETSAQVPVVDNHATVRVLDRNELAIQAIRKIITDKRMSLDELIKNSVHPSAGTVGVKDHAEVSEILGIEGIRIVDGDFVVDEDVIERLKAEKPSDIREFIHTISSRSLPVVFLGNILNNIIHQEGFDWEESSRLYRELERILAPRGMMAYATNEVYFHWYKAHEKRAGSPETKETKNVIQTLEDAGLDILFKTTKEDVVEYEGAVSENCVLITGRSDEYDALPGADEAIRVSRERLQMILPKGMELIERTTSFREFKKILESGQETNLVLIKSGHDQYVSFNVPGRFKEVFTRLATDKDTGYFGIEDILAESVIKNAHSMVTIRPPSLPPGQAQGLGASKGTVQDLIFRAISEYDPVRYVILGDAEGFRSKGEGVEQINAGMREFYNANPPDKGKLSEEYTEMARILEQYGVEVYRPTVSPDVPQQLAPRDIGFVIGDTFVVSNMTWKSRRQEINAIKDILGKFGGRILEVPADVKIEGGNIAIDGDTIFIGIGLRTSPNAIDFLKREFGGKFNIIPVYLNDKEEIIHLDAVFNIVGKGYAVVYEEGIKNFSDLPKGYKFLRVTKEEKDQGACNMFSIDGKALIVRKGINRVKLELEKAGFICHEVSWDETKKTGTVGPRCAILPLYRAILNAKQQDTLQSARASDKAL